MSAPQHPRPGRPRGHLKPSGGRDRHHCPQRRRPGMSSRYLDNTMWGQPDRLLPHHRRVFSQTSWLPGPVQSRGVRAWCATDPKRPQPRSRKCRSTDPMGRHSTRCPAPNPGAILREKVSVGLPSAHRSESERNQERVLAQAEGSGGRREQCNQRDRHRQP
jgi:hypothetical protein